MVARLLAVCCTGAQDSVIDLGIAERARASAPAGRPLVVLDLAAAAGGSIAAEHGIGVAKVAALARNAEPARLAAMGLLKRSLDPGGLLNPGVILAG